MRLPARLLAVSFIPLAFAAPPPPPSFDHVTAIKSLNADDLTAGKKLYTEHCVACHGSDGNLTQNPLARRFAKDDLKFGADPYALWKTVSYGNGLMFRYDAVLSAQQRHQVVHYIRETFIKQNAKPYAALPDDYFAKLPKRADSDAHKHATAMPSIVIPPGMRDGKMGKEMLYGPAQAHSMAVTKDPDEKPNAVRYTGTTEKALAVMLPGGTVICYDTARLSISGLWADRLADISNSHHTSYKGAHSLAPGGAPIFTDVGADGWRTGSANAPAKANTVTFNGHYLHRDQVLLNYEVASRRIFELPGALLDRSALSRSFEIAAGESPLFCRVGRVAGGKLNSTVTTVTTATIAALTAGTRTLHAALNGETAGLEFTSDADGVLWLTIPKSAAPRRFTLRFGFQRALDAKSRSATPDLTTLTRGGPRRWPEAVQTTVIPGKSIDGYAADELTLPYGNPWGSWMRMSAVDFFADGRIAVSTLSGDVWIVTSDKANPDQLSWSRFANGLYEPLGLRVVNDTVYVRCRDRIVRLHDLNTDGEADFYESFYNEPGEIGASYHAFIFELQTDKTGNFYYSKSGRKTPHKAAVVRLSPDGKKAETIAGDMRHPNGMGAGGPNDWITVSDNPSGKSIYNGFSLVREGASFGYEKSRNTPMVMILPASVDSSSTGQVWSDAKRWGPLGGSVVHTSYSHCAMFTVSVQDVAPFPNGFAIRLPFDFKAGLMRSRVSPVDGQIYTVGLKGWDTKANYDGCFYRVRYTGEASHLIQNVAATRTGLRLTLSCDIDRASVKAGAVTVTREADKKRTTAPVALGAVSLSTPRTLDIALPQIDEERVVHRTTKDAKTGETVVDILMPLVFAVKLKATDGASIDQTIYATINSLP